MTDPIIVPAVGPKECLIAFVGEAPGADEERGFMRDGKLVREPFVGAAGKLLDSIMRSVGINRRDCYITNVVKVRPPGNDIKFYCDIKPNGSVAKHPFFDTFVESLMQELSEVTANVIVPLGNVPMWVLTGKHGIMKRRGSIMASTSGRKIIPTIHPAAALRQFDLSYFIAHDLETKVIPESITPEVSLPQRNIMLAPTLHQALDFIDYAHSMKVIATDIEVVNEELACFSIAINERDVICVPLKCSSGHYFDIEDELTIMTAYGRLLEDPAVIKVNQNILFDASFLLRKYGIHMRPVDDTMIAQAIAYPDFPKGLDFITSWYTREPYYKDEGKKWMKFGGTDTDFWIYNAKDSAVAIESFPLIINEIKELKDESTYKRQNGLIEPLMYMQERGLRVDSAGMQAESQRLDKVINEASDVLNSMVGYQINPNSNKQLTDYFYIKKGLTPYINRKTGAWTLDEKALKRISRKGFQEASIILDIRGATKMKSTYLDVTLSADGRLRGSFNPVGTVSGRLSSSANIFGEGTNLENLPATLQQFIYADNGYLIFNTDLSQAENRIVAYIAPVPEMIDAFERKLDVHRMTAALIFNKPMSEISDVDGSCSIGSGTYSERFWGKKANHGLNYDLGAETFSLYYEIPKKEAEFIVNRYHLAYPGVRLYHGWVQHAIQSTRMLTNCQPFNRTRLFTGRLDHELFKSAYSFIPQSTVPDIINEWGLNYTYFEPSLSPVELLNQVHDSIWYQIPIHAGTQVMADCLIRIKQSLEQPISFRGRTFVIPAETKVGFKLKKKEMLDLKITTVTETKQQLDQYLKSLEGYDTGVWRSQVV